VGSTSANFTTNNNAFTISLTQGSGSLTIVIAGQNVTGPRVVLLNISRDSFLNVQSGYLQVSLDNSTIAEAASLEAVLTGTGLPSYILIGTSSGFELLVSIPHFSTHTIVITTPPESVATAGASVTAAASSSGIPTSYIVSALVVVVAVVLVAAFAVRGQLNKRTSSAGSSV
jgi:hypothetical protein